MWVLRHVHVGIQARACGYPGTCMWVSRHHALPLLLDARHGGHEILVAADEHPDVVTVRNLRHREREGEFTRIAKPKH